MWAVAFRSVLPLKKNTIQQNFKTKVQIGIGVFCVLDDLLAVYVEQLDSGIGFPALFMPRLAHVDLGAQGSRGKGNPIPLSKCELVDH